MTRSLLFFALLFTTAASAKTVEGYNFEESITVGERNLLLNGVGMRLATIFSVKVYAAGLYLEKKGTDSGEILGRDEAWQLVMAFTRDVGEEDLKKSIREAFEKNGLESFEKKISILTDAIRGVKKGDVVKLTYTPGKGTSVLWGKNVGQTITGARFAKGLLTCWIGKKPPNKELRTGLLGG